MQKKFLLFLMLANFAFAAIQAQTIQYGALLLGSKEAPPNPSPGVGGAKVTIDATANTMRVECAFNGLEGNVTTAHIHGPTTTPGSGTAGVITTTPTFPSFPSGVTAGSYDQTFDMTLSSSYNAAFISANGGTTSGAFAALQSAIAAGKTYVNIHSSVYPGGEIRGFLVPCATTSTTNLAICPSELPFVWNGLTFNGAGSQTKVFPNGNAVGCDSSATLNLTVKSNSSSSTTVSVCNKYTWNGTEYKVSGNYMYHTTNAQGCDSMAELDLTILSVTSTFSQTNVVGCSGSATGSITVVPTYGVAPFTYKLGTNGTFGNSNVFTGLRAGSYRVFILDANGCAGLTDPIIITQPQALTATTTIVNPTCYGSTNGSITVNASNGTTPYTYRLGTSGSYGTSNTFMNVRGGSYRVYVKDAAGCLANFSAIVAQPSKVNLTFSSTDLTCFDANNGTITLMASGGSGTGYMYRLGTTGLYNSSNTFTGLRPGSFRGFAKDGNNCLSNSVSVIINQSIDPCNPDGFRSTPKNTINSTKFDITIAPNPSSNQFALNTHGGNLNESVLVRVLDINGKSIYQSKIKGEQVLRFGSEFAPGMYMIEVRQGNEVKILKAVKIK